MIKSVDHGGDAGETTRVNMYVSYPSTDARVALFSQLPPAIGAL